MNDGPWCWCHARWGLAVPATQKSNGIGDRAPTENDTCRACANRSSTACHNAHRKEAAGQQPPQ